ncbi:MAG: peptidylprolyl isomerase [candidate division Zixibacteria bacterium]|nr:peptidylprolyl isomerase [candidate division Zixibacteria bacterium]
MKKILTALAVVVLLVCAYFLYETYKGKSRPEKLADIIHQEDLRQINNTLTGYLDDDSDEIRARAALAIGRIGSDKSAELLFQKLKDESIDVAATAAFAMGLTGDTAYAWRLLEAAHDLPAAIAASAVVSAGRLSDSSKADVNAELINFLGHISADVREEACYALFYANAKEQAKVLASMYTMEPDSLTKEAALFTLARFGLDEGTPVFINYLADSDPYLRGLAVRGMSKSTSPDAERYLEIALNDRDHNVAAQAVAALKARNQPMSAPRLAGKLSREDDEKLQVELISALQALGRNDAVELVRTIFLGSPSINVINASVQYLASIEGDRTVGIIDSLIRGESPARLKAGCATAYALIGGSGVIPRLTVLFTDEDPIVRAAAFGALTDIDSANIDFYLSKALDDPDMVVVSLAIDKVKEGYLVTYLPKLAAFIDRGKEIDIDIRRAIVDATSAFLGGESDSLAREILVKAALDPEYIVRKDASKVYKEKLSEDRQSFVRQPQTQISYKQLVEAVEMYKQNPRILISTSKGDIELELFFETAPLTVLNFIALAKDGFYDGLQFHRVVPNFVIQGGDPRGDGWGGPGYYIRCEYSAKLYRRGTLGIATSGKDTGGSQFFITHSPQPHLNARYTIFGQVISGMETVDNIVIGDTIERVVIQES